MLQIAQPVLNYPVLNLPCFVKRNKKKSQLVPGHLLGRGERGGGRFSQGSQGHCFLWLGFSTAFEYNGVQFRFPLHIRLTSHPVKSVASSI